MFLKKLEKWLVCMVLNKQSEGDPQNEGRLLHKLSLDL